MDLVVNNLQRLICHKTQPTNQSKVSGTLLKLCSLSVVGLLTIKSREEET